MLSRLIHYFDGLNDFFLLFKNRQPETPMNLKRQDLSLTSNLRNSFLTVIPTLSKSLSYWVTLDSHWGPERTRILPKERHFPADFQNKTDCEFRTGTRTIPSLCAQSCVAASVCYLTDLLFGLLEFVWFVGPQQLGLGLSLLLQRALSLLPALPCTYALVKTSLKTRATPGNPVSNQTPAGNWCS